jgi:hypothetical protein
MMGMGGLDTERQEFDPDLADLNDPDVVTLGEPPLVGKKFNDPTNMYGYEAEPVGRASSPLLYASAAQFPSATQLRVWKWENGVPNGIGAIDAQATEEDFIRRFFTAMPRRGEGRGQYKIRPIDIRGHELGKEATISISEHHAYLQDLRQQKEEENNVSNTPAQVFGPGRGGDVIVNGGGDAGGSAYAEEMGRMFEQQQEFSERQTQMYQEQLERERAELRMLEKERAEERVRTAERAASTVEVMTNRLMQTDKSRSEEVLAMTKDQNNLMLSTLTTVFSQQSAAQREAAERQRQMDELKAKQDREFFERQRQEMEIRRAQEREEAEARRRAEREEFEARRRLEKEEWERRQAELKMEMERRAEKERQELLMRAQQMEAERIRWQAEMERRERTEREERERRDRAEREERERKEKMEFERMERERAEAERRETARREEMARIERLERDRIERERQELLLRMEREKQDLERRESLRREELQREENRRREELQLSLKQMEISTSRDREHAERMMEMARQEREAAREAGLAREKLEREAREQAERDRQRQHDLQVKEMEIARERDREHAERMVQMTRAQHSGGLTGLTDMLGMETPELLSRIFGGSGSGDGENAGGGWSETIPKVLGAIADLGKVAVANQAAMQQQQQPKTKRPARDMQPNMVAIQTPEGIRMVPASSVSLPPPPAALPAPAMPDISDLPTQGFIPAEIPAQPRRARPVQRQAQMPAAPMPAAPMPEALHQDESPVPSVSEVTPVMPTAEDAAANEVLSRLMAGSEVSTLRRAKAAGINPIQQRKARQGVKDLVGKLSKSPEEEWVGLVTAAITTDIGIYNYLKAVTVYAALAELRVEPELAGRIVAALKTSGLVPEGMLPYDEADYAKQVSGEAEKVADEMATALSEVAE